MSTNPLNDISRVYLEQIVESAVPGKPAEKLGAVTAIPKDEQEAARQRTLAKAKAMREKKGIKEAAKPDYLDFDSDGNEKESMKKALKDKAKQKMEEAKKPNDGNLANNYPPYDKVTRGDVIAGRLGKDQMGGKKKVVKEGFSNWREDLREVMSSAEKADDGARITEKKVNNKIKTSAMGGGITLPEAVEGLGGTLVEMVELDEEFIYESAATAAQYFYEQGLNEFGVEILIEELGLDEFSSFVFDINNDIISEARAGGVRVEPVTAKGQKFKSGKPTGKSLERLRKLKAERKASEERASAAKPSGMKAALQRQSAVASAKKQQPKKKGVLDRVAGAVLKGMERHQQATSAAKQAFQKGMERHKKATATASHLAKETGKTAAKAGKIAGHVAKSAASGASQTAKGVKKAVVGEEAELQEKITAKTDMGAAIKDFYTSKSPQLAGRTKEERRKAAIAAVLTARRGGKKRVEEQAMELQPKTQQQSQAEKPNPALVAKQKQAVALQKQIEMKKLQALSRGIPLTQSYDMEGEMIGEEDYDTMKDRHLERGGMGIRASQSPAKTGTSKPVDRQKQKETAQKALELVRQSVIAKHGKSSLM